MVLVLALRDYGITEHMINSRKVNQLYDNDMVMATASQCCGGGWNWKQSSYRCAMMRLVGQ